MNLRGHAARHRHVARRADDRLRLRGVPSTDPRDRRLAPLDPDRAAERPRRRRRPSPRRSRTILVDTSTDLRAQALATTSAASTRSSSPTAMPTTCSGSTKCAASTPAAAQPIPCYRGRADARPICAGRLRTSSIRRHAEGRRHSADRRCTEIAGPFSLGGVGNRAGADHARPAADSRLSHRRVRLPDRLQRDSRRVVAAARPACARWCSTRCAIGRIRPTSACRRRSRPSARIGAERTYFTHICHELPHAETCARLPRGVELAYDGLVLEMPADAKLD